VYSSTGSPVCHENRGRDWCFAHTFSYLKARSGRERDRLPVRVAKHNVTLLCGDGEQVSETCTLITTPLDRQAAPAAAVRDAYQARWSASETTFGEEKTTIAGNRASGPVLRSGSPRLVI
jgi:hypothetical protein